MKKILSILLLFPILGTAQSYLAKSVNGNNADVNGNVTISTAVDSVSKIGDSLIVIKAGLRRSYSLGSSGGGSISGLTAATATNSINNLNYKQRWFANTIGADTAFVLGSSSTAAASNLQTVLSVNQSGANATSTQSTYGIKISNKKTGTASTNIGIDLDVSGGGTNNAINVTSGRVLLNGNSLVMGKQQPFLITGDYNLKIRP